MVEKVAKRVIKETKKILKNTNIFWGGYLQGQSHFQDDGTQN